MHDPTPDYASSKETSKISHVFHKKNVETCCLHQSNVTYLFHKQFSSCLHPYKVYLAITNFPFYKLIHVGIKGQSLNCNFFFSFLKCVEASCK
jgi:hypothetical protein